jgi:predicted RNase H-like HicB family nuclease
MGLGWGILLGPMFDSINTNIRQLIDAGTLQLTASNSGLISKQLASGRGNSTESGPVEIVLGQFTQVDSHGSSSLKDNIAQFPFAGPSPVLFQLMESLTNSARSLTNASVNVQAQAGEAAALYLARLQQGLKIPNSIIMRVYDCAKKELQKISLLNYKHFDDEKYNRILDLDSHASMEKDFNPKDFDIRMVADPSQGSDIERVQRAQVAYEMAKDPQQPGQVLNYRKAVLDLMEAMGTPNIEELAPEPDPNARDPQAEMQQALIAQQMAEMENQKEANNLRAQENQMKAASLQLQQQKQAMQAAKDMGELGLKKDKLEAETTRMYMQSLEGFAKLGVSPESAIQLTKDVENFFLESKAGQQTPEPQADQEFEYDPFTSELMPKAANNAVL